MLAAERLGGADYDGDMVKTIADPILNECVRRNYEASRGSADDALSNEANIPLLMIPSATPLIRSAEDWEARFEVVRGTFSSRVGQICNAALDRSIIAYNENSDAEERKRLQDETEVLAILTGLEIDSAKSGIRPDLDEYLKKRRVRRTPFLQYKNLVEDAEETRRAWYEETHQQRIKAFFKKIDWDKVDSNLERLPYLALQLKKHTPAARAKPARDHELFTFAQQPDWKEHLDGEILEQISALLRDYEACLSRIRACRVEPSEKKRKSDIARILFARGQEELWDTDELYAQLESLSTLTEGAWTIRFDDMIADALELGPLRCTEPELPAELAEQLEQVCPEKMPSNILPTLVAYYLANCPEDSDWVVLPVTNFDCYFGNTNFGRKYLNQLPREVIERSNSFGISRYRVREEYLPK